MIFKEVEIKLSEKRQRATFNSILEEVKFRWKENSISFSTDEELFDGYNLYSKDEKELAETIVEIKNEKHYLIYVARNDDYGSYVKISDFKKILKSFLLSEQKLFYSLVFLNPNDISEDAHDSIIESLINRFKFFLDSSYEDHKSIPLPKLSI